MRIRFIEPHPPGHHVYDNALLPRLGLPLMATMLADKGHDVVCYCESLAPIDVADCLGADLVGISSTTSTQPRAYALAAEFEGAGVPVVLGGPHVTFLADEALEHARFVVRGEGERTIGELVRVLENERNLDGIAGLSWRDSDGTPRHNPDRARCDQAGFEALPRPDLTLVAEHDRLGTKPLMTQWGCPYDCEFCSVTAMFSRSVRYRRPDQVLAEIRVLDSERLFFHDDNFVVNKRRTEQLLRGMIAADLTPTWAAQVRADTVFRSRASREPDHEFLALMKAAGCWMVMVGFESVSEEALRQMNKRQSLRDVTESVDLFHAHGIKVHGMFVVGTDSDPADQPDRTVEVARRLGIDTIQLMIETPLPGTRLFRRAESEDRLLTRDWSLYDGHHAVMRPGRADPYELQVRTLAAMKRFYSRPGIIGPAVRNALRDLPGLAALAIRNRLPAKLLARRQQGDLLERLRNSLPAPDWSRLEDAFAVPALRAYGRRQVAKWWEQPHSQDHVRFLAALP